jgi:hypothetical protein
MKHRLTVLLPSRLRIVRLRRPGWAFALLAALPACDAGRTTLVVLSDTTAATAPRVVVALPFDPAALPAPAPAALPDGPRGDSVRLALARRDSMLRADVAWQGARTTANTAARALAPLDRRTAEYARRFAEWRRLADSAERLRDRRDAHSAHLTRLSQRLGDDARHLDATPPTRSRQAADSAARAMGGRIAEATLQSGAARLELADGEWWLTHTSQDGALRVPAIRRVLLSGTRDTVDLRQSGRAAAGSP